MDIVIYTQSGTERFRTTINEGAKRKCELMKEDYITLPFNLMSPVLFEIGDWCQLDLGSKYPLCNGKYYITQKQKPTYSTSDGGWHYELQLDKYYWIWKNHICKFIPYSTEVGNQEISWTLTAGLDSHMLVVLRNINALGWTLEENQGISFETDESLKDTKDNAKFISYDGINIIDALTAIAEAWECEWWVVDNVIWFGKAEQGDVIDFSLDTNCLDMTASNNKSEYGTRIFLFGSTRNLPRSYRKGSDSLVVNGVAETRLMLPLSWTNGISDGQSVNYIDYDYEQPEALRTVNDLNAVEAYLVTDEVYPRSNSSIASWEWKEVKEQDDDGVEQTYKYFRFRDTAATRPSNPLLFSKDYIIDGEELQIKFLSGNLNGMEFAVAFNPDGKDEQIKDEATGKMVANPDAQVWEIIVNDTYGRSLPDESLHPAINDKFAILGWDATKFNTEDSNGNTVLATYVAEAEEELLELGKKYIEKIKIDPETYNCTLKFSDFFDDEGNALTMYDLGQRVRLHNAAFFEGDGHTRESRVIGFEINLDIPYDSPVYIVGESATKSRLGELESKLDSISKLTGEVAFSGSSSGSGSTGAATEQATLKEDILTMIQVGYINKSITLRKGMTWEEIFRQMFLTVTQAALTGSITHGDGSHSNDVEYGTLKGYIDYIAIRNDAGAMELAWIDGNVEVTFSAETADKKQTYRRLLNQDNGIYTANETYNLSVRYGKNDNYPEGLTLSNKITVNVHRKWFVGGSDTIPDSTWNSDKIRGLEKNGLLSGTSFSAILNNGYGRVLIIAIPSQYSIASCKCSETNNSDISTDTGRFLQLSNTINVEGANGSNSIAYRIYYYKMDSPVTDKRTYNITLK